MAVFPEISVNAGPVITRYVVSLEAATSGFAFKLLRSVSES